MMYGATAAKSLMVLGVPVAFILSPLLAVFGPLVLAVKTVDAIMEAYDE